MRRDIWSERFIGINRDVWRFNLSPYVSANLNLSQRISLYLKEAQVQEVREYDLPGVKSYDLKVIPDEQRRPWNDPTIIDPKTGQPFDWDRPPHK